MRRNGRFTVQRAEWPQEASAVKQLARTMGPSMARITSSAEMSARIARQPVAAVGAVCGRQKTRFAELLQKFREQRQAECRNYPPLPWR